MYENYVKIRDSKGYKDADVSRGTGISPGVFSDWKKGRYELKYEKLKRIADFFGVTIEQLTGDSIADPADGWYVDGETAEIAQSIFDDQDLRILFDAARGSRPEYLAAAAEMLKKLKETNHDA